MISTTIGNFTFFDGQLVSCRIKGVLFDKAAINISRDENNNSCWICHSNPEYDGSGAENKFGFRYSWIFYIRPDGTLTDEVSELRPLIPGLEYKNVQISEDLNLFIEAYDVDFNYFKSKVGIFDEFSKIEISPNIGFIKFSNEKKSTEIKFGRFIRKVSNKISLLSDLYKNPTDKEIENLHNKYVSHQKGDDFKLVFLVGEDIKLGYSSKEYHGKDYSTLHKSCMTDKFKFLDIYTKNPNQVKLAIIKIQDKIAARCIVWKTESGKEFFDRIYYSYEWMNELMKSKLESQNLRFIKESSLEMVKLDNWEFEKYPYIDNFYYFDKSNGTLLSLNNCVVLRNTDGGMN